MIDWFRKIAPIRVKMLALALGATTMTMMASVVSIIGNTHGNALWAVGLSLPFAFATLLFGLGARRAICDPYVTTVKRMEALAAGDLASPIGFTDHGDCVGRLARGMLTFRDVAVGEIERSRERSVLVTVLETHLSDLSRRNEASATSLEETATSIAQMDERLKTAVKAAGRTVERADQAILAVHGGRAVADQAVQAMGRVSDSAQGIDSVIEGLDKIAFQTRMLAMNAAVEAGRAGPAGRGFAVVADLVSALAMRAEEEAKCARGQLTVTQTDILTAVDAVQKMDGALADISGDVGQVHELLAMMAADNLAQSAAITQISSAIGTIDLATQQNAAMVEETSAATRNLASESGGPAEHTHSLNLDPYTPAYRKLGRMRDAETAVLGKPAKPLPAAGISALVRTPEDWRAF